MPEAERLNLKQSVIMLMIPPNFLRQEDKAVEFLSGLFQMLGPIGVLVGGFAAASLSVSGSFPSFEMRSDAHKHREHRSEVPHLSLLPG